jgi:hypothetical protein
LNTCNVGEVWNKPHIFGILGDRKLKSCEDTAIDTAYRFRECSLVHVKATWKVKTWQESIYEEEKQWLLGYRLCRVKLLRMHLPKQRRQWPRLVGCQFRHMCPPLGSHMQRKQVLLQPQLVPPPLGWLTCISTHVHSTLSTVRECSNHMWWQVRDGMPNPSWDILKMIIEVVPKLVLHFEPDIIGVPEQNWHQTTVP